MTPSLSTSYRQFGHRVGEHLDEDSRASVYGSDRDDAAERAARRIVFDISTGVAIARACVLAPPPGNDDDDDDDYSTDLRTSGWSVQIERRGTELQRRMRARARRVIDDSYILREAAGEIAACPRDERLELWSFGDRTSTDARGYAKALRLDYGHVRDAMEIAADSILQASDAAVATLTALFLRRDILTPTQLDAAQVIPRSWPAAFEAALWP